MKNKIAIIGLGYVGLPLATEFARKYKVVGFDIDKSRTEELSNCKDKTGEINLTDFCKKNYAAIILAVAHDDFKAIDFTQLHSDSTVVFDVKSFIETKYIDGRL